MDVYTWNFRCSSFAGFYTRHPSQRANTNPIFLSSVHNFLAKKPIEAQKQTTLKGPGEGIPQNRLLALRPSALFPELRTQVSMTGDLQGNNLREVVGHERGAQNPKQNWVAAKELKLS